MQKRDKHNNNKNYKVDYIITCRCDINLLFRRNVILKIQANELEWVELKNLK